MLSAVLRLAAFIEPHSTQQALGRWRVLYGFLMIVWSLVWLNPSRFQVVAPLLDTRIEALSIDLTLWYGPLFWIMVLAWFGVAVGLRTTIAQALGWSCLTALLYIRSAGHDVTPLYLFSTCAIVFPWGLVFTLDSLWSRRRRNRPPEPELTAGEAAFPYWLLLLLLGFGYGGAALHKLAAAGPAWVVSGVRGAFMEDWAFALRPLPVDWLNNSWLIGAMGLVAIMVELAWLLAPFYFRRRARTVLILLTYSLISGFLVIQGHFWPAWFTMLTLALISPGVLQSTRALSSAATSLTSPFRVRYALCCLLVIATHLTGIVAWREYSFVVPRYTMYVETFTEATAKSYMDDKQERGTDYRFAVVSLGCDGTRDEMGFGTKLFHHFRESFHRSDVLAQEISRARQLEAQPTEADVAEYLVRSFNIDGRHSCGVELREQSRIYYSDSTGISVEPGSRIFTIGPDGRVEVQPFERASNH